MDKVVLILEFGLLLIIGVVVAHLIKTICEMLRPDYLKPESFFRMENDSDLLEITAEEGLQVTVHYADHIYADYAGGENTI